MISSPQISDMLIRSLGCKEWGHLCHQAPEVSPRLRCGLGADIPDQGNDRSTTWVSPCVFRSGFFVYSDEGVNKGKRKCPLCEGRVCIQPCSRTQSHSETTCCTKTHTHTFVASLGYRRFNQWQIGAAMMLSKVYKRRWRSKQSHSAPQGECISLRF